VLALIPSPDVDLVEASERTFDFSKSPNVQKVDFGVRWVGGGLLWIPTALSTLRPPTSPRISTIRLDFALHFATNRSAETLLVGAGSDLRRVAGEFDRIEREFEGAVTLNVSRDPVFKAVLDTLGVSFRFCRVNNTPRIYLFIPRKSSSVTLVETGTYPICPSLLVILPLIRCQLTHPDANFSTVSGTSHKWGNDKPRFRFVCTPFSSVHKTRSVPPLVDRRACWCFPGRFSMVLSHQLTLRCRCRPSLFPSIMPRAPQVDIVQGHAHDYDLF